MQSQGKKRNKLLCLSIVVVILFISGCGAGFFRSYGCKAPDGSKCQSIEETYKGKSQIVNSNGPDKKSDPVSSFSPEIRKPEKIQKIWVSEHVTPEGDYQKGTYIYMVIEPAKWRTEGSQVSVKVPYKEEPIKPQGKAVPPEIETIKESPRPEIKFPTKTDTPGKVK